MTARYKLLGLILCICFFSQIVLALDCNYQEPIQISVAGIQAKGTTACISSPLISLNDSFSDGRAVGFTVKNTTNYDINAIVDYTIDRTGHYYTNPSNCAHKDPPTAPVIFVAAQRTLSITEPYNACEGYIVPYPIYTYIENDYVTPATCSETIYECKKCPVNGDTNCLDDGNPCTNSSQCGGGFCVENYCSSSDICPGKPPNCKCAEPLKTQCTNETSPLFNKKCVQVGAVPDGSKPSCGLEQECLSKYLNEEGVCGVSYIVAAKSINNDLNQQKILNSLIAQLSEKKVPLTNSLIQNKTNADSALSEAQIELSYNPSDALAKSTNANALYAAAIKEAQGLIPPVCSSTQHLENNICVTNTDWPFIFIVIVAAIIVIVLMLTSGPRGPVYRVTSYIERIR